MKVMHGTANGEEFMRLEFDSFQDRDWETFASSRQ